MKNCVIPTARIKPGIPYPIESNSFKFDPNLLLLNLRSAFINRESEQHIIAVTILNNKVLETEYKYLISNLIGC